MNARSIAWLSVAALAVLLNLPCAHAQDGARRARFMQRHAHQSDQPVNLPGDIQVTRDVTYGSDPLQRFDVYAPAQAHDAPVIFMVHGGGWRRGDKAARGVIQNKVARWVPRGFIVVSTNYPLLPDNAPLQQAQNVARALATAQREASEWGGDEHQFIVMGHSAGAHLVALLTADPALARAQGALPWLGSVLLDSAALNVVQIMQSHHVRLYDEAFGANPSDWQAVSPYQQLRAKTVPFLAVCSSERKDSCARSQAFVQKARSLGSRAEALPEDLRHGEINKQLGAPSDYTRQVEAFLRSLSPDVARVLDKPSP